MKIEHTAFRKGDDGFKWCRWRIADDDGEVILQGKSWHRTREAAQIEINDVLEFLEAWSRERVQFGGF